jgi:hypothetical protein
MASEAKANPRLKVKAIFWIAFFAQNVVGVKLLAILPLDPAAYLASEVSPSSNGQ